MADPPAKISHLTLPPHPLWQVIVLNPGDVVEITASIGTANKNGSVAGCTYPQNSGKSPGNVVMNHSITLGSYIVSNETAIRMNPTQLRTPICTSASAGLCTARVGSVCREVDSSSPTAASDIGCQQWPVSSEAAPNAGGMFGAFTQSIVNSGNRSSYSATFSYTVRQSQELGLLNPFRLFCLAAKSIRGCTAPTDVGCTGCNTVDIWEYGPQACMLFLFTVPPASLNCSSIIPGFTVSPTTPCGTSSLVDPSTPPPPTCGQAEGVWCSWPPTIAIGQPLSAYMYYQPQYVSPNLASADGNTVMLLASPGLPNGASVGSMEMVRLTLLDSTGTSVSFPIFRKRVTFNASASDLEVFANGGVTSLGSVQYSVCFTAAYGAITASNLCATIKVVSPAPQVVLGLSSLQFDPACVAAGTCSPSFACPAAGAGGASCAPTGAAPDIRIRCDYSWTVVTYDARGGADLLRGLSTQLYAPQLVADPLNPLPDGVELSPPATAVVASSEAVGGVQWAIGRVRSTQTITWTPSHGMEGRRFRLCALLQAGAATQQPVVAPCWL